MLGRISLPRGLPEKIPFDTAGRPLLMATMTITQVVSRTRSGGVAFVREELVLILDDLDSHPAVSKKGTDVNVIDFEGVCVTIHSNRLGLLDPSAPC